MRSASLGRACLIEIFTSVILIILKNAAKLLKNDEMTKDFCL